jgi:hypothetical protein
MVRPLAFAIPLTFTLLLFSPARGSHDDPAIWLDLLDDQTFAAAGLDKLTDAERSVLAGLLIQPAGPSFLEQEAVAYMEQNGWEPVDVTAILAGEGGHRIVAQDDEGTALLEAWSSIEPLPPPGTHWAKKMGVWDILNPDGTSHHFSD